MERYLGMLISVKEINFVLRFKPNVILHVGAHKAEESFEYEKYEWGREKIIWVESQKNLTQFLQTLFLTKSNYQVIQATVWDHSGLEKTFYHTSNSQSSSLFSLGNHLNYFPEIVETYSEKVTTVRLDEILDKRSRIDFVNLDLQGSELQALKSLGNMLQNIKVIYTEVNRSDVYIGCSKIWEIDEYLSGYGFRRIATRWAFEQDWGDALYTRNSNMILILYFKFINIFQLLTTNVRYKLHAFKEQFLKSND